MPFTAVARATDEPHCWIVIQDKCDPSDPEDALLHAAVDLFREAYGEGQILALAADPGVEAAFDLTAILRALRSGYPDPAFEGNKPVHLTNYRSEPTEIIARGALRAAYDVEFPTSPQLGKSNANMPILGFDGWGIRRTNAEFRLVLLQVKGTEDADAPPRIAHKLKAECHQIPNAPAAVARALSILVVFLRDTEYLQPLLQMLAELGNGQVPKLAIAPIIVRGVTEARLEDLMPIRESAHALLPTHVLGITMSVGLDLSDFGRLVIERARAA